MRRINYNYLIRLADRLETLGSNIHEIPPAILEQTWDRIRDFIQVNLDLPYCIRCKLPIPHADLSEYQNICNFHAKNFAASWRNRRHSKLDRADPRAAAIAQHAREDQQAKIIAASLAQQILTGQKANHPETPSVVVSKPETPRDVATNPEAPTVLSILGVMHAKESK
jgi:hypothetical protein